jgi:hypothetical protein
MHLQSLQHHQRLPFDVARDKTLDYSQGWPMKGFKLWEAAAQEALEEADMLDALTGS